MNFFKKIFRKTSSVATTNKNNTTNVKDFIQKHKTIDLTLINKYYDPTGNPSKENPQTDVIDGKRINFAIEGYYNNPEINLFAKFDTDKTWTLIHTMDGDH